MLTAGVLAARPELTILEVGCADDHTRWSPAEVRADYRLVLVRRGRFRRRVAGEVVDLDRTVGYLGVPDEAEHFAHPCGGDGCTSISLSPELGARLTDSRPRPSVYVDARVELAHRRLLAGAHDVDYALVEALLALLAGTLAQTGTAPGRVPPRPDDRLLVSRAREAMTAAEPAAAGLLSLAALLDVSPYRLSRAFTRELGVSLTRYRNRVRVGRALERLAQGERDLALLAADLGFADQGHLSRTTRQHLGQPPTALRGLLAGGAKFRS